MTDTEKIEWLSAINKALMESQERLAGEIKELRELAYIGDHHFPDLTWKARFDELLEENRKLRKVLHFVRRNIPDYLPEYDSGDSPSEVVKECSVEIAMGLVKINKALNELGMVYWNE